MGTLVCFHAHPDDESITSGGTMAKASAEGHRVVLVLATGGENGEVPDDLASGETLKERRRVETERSADILGVARIAWLGYEDSGMQGWEQNGNPASFLQADVDDAAGRLASILREEDADVLTTYDWHGNYGHPDHIKVHTVGHRAAALASTPIVYEVTINRDEMERFMATHADALSNESGERPTTDDGNPFGQPESELTTAVDVSAFIDAKRRSLMCHASQVTDSGLFLRMPPEIFLEAFGTEWFTRVGAPKGIHESELAGLESHEA
jgi:LmbE family N-acetylglucosaminyl deacetylase